METKAHSKISLASTMKLLNRTHLLCIMVRARRLRRAPDAISLGESPRWVDISNKIQFYSKVGLLFMISIPKYYL